MKNGKETIEIKETKKRKQVAKVRLRILQLAREQGEISNKQAAKAAKLKQVWFHLNALKKAGLLRHVGYNTWKPKRGRPVQRVEL